jgi:hypothetical protein
MWLSRRRIRRASDLDWDKYTQFVGLPHLEELRSIDSWCSPCLKGNFPVDTLDELWEVINLEGLTPESDGSEYNLLFTDALARNGSVVHPQLKLLGYDLSDETWTSSLLNCGQWQGALAAIARRTGRNGLLSLEDARLAQALLPEAWGGDPHSYVTVWALLEVTAPGALQA